MSFIQTAPTTHLGDQATHQLPVTQPNIQQLEQELARIHTNNSHQMNGSQMAASNPSAQPNVANTMVVDNLTYSDALKLRPEPVVETNTLPAETVSAAISNAPPIHMAKPEHAMPVLPNVRKISRFQVSVVDPVIVLNIDTSIAGASQSTQLMQQPATISQPPTISQPLHQTESSPEQMESSIYHGSISNSGQHASVSMAVTQPTMNFSQIQQHIPQSHANIYHPQQVENNGNIQQQLVASNVSASVSNSNAHAGQIQIAMPTHHLSGKRNNVQYASKSCAAKAHKRITLTR